jgi:hypothetical protein
MNLTPRSRATVAPEPEKDALVFHGVEVDHCSTYYLLYEYNCSEAEPQSPPEPEKKALVFHGVEVDRCSIYYLLSESYCSEAGLQLH